METIDNVVAKLAPGSLLRALEPAQLADLLSKAHPRELEPGDTVINQGDEDGDFAVFLLAGGLKISRVSAGGREITLNYTSPGKVVGEIALLDSGPRTATVTAAARSRVLILPSRLFLDILAQNPASMVGVLREMASRVRELNRVIESDRTFSMGPRLARALVRLIDPESEDGRLFTNPTQSDLGAFAGLARENVSRLLSEWEAKGIVAREGRALLVRDATYLEQLSEWGDEA